MWRIFTEEMYVDDEQAYIAYGVRNGSFCLADFSSVKSEAERFAELLNRFDVSPIHAADVAEDYFGSAEYLR
ncbi:MAG: DUF6514 family protein [Oscillospiraceae bacterium]